jgi:hypothetical protein
MGEQAAALRELILRIVAPADPQSPEYANPLLLAGRLPDTLQIDLPLPPATRVLGSLLLTKRTTIYLESQTLPRQILSFYRERLPALRWSFFGEARNLGGFTVGEVPERASCQFCSATEAAGLSVSAHVTPSGVTDLRLQLVTDPSQTPCANPNTPPAWEYRNRQPRLPELAAPSEGDIVGGGGSGSPWHCESRGYLYTGMALSAVANHYGLQFQTSGWIRQDEGNDELVAWSRWARQAEEDRSVDALFLAVRYPNTDRYFLVARASYPDEASAPIAQP